jgi:hypothetical protein
MSDVNLLDDFVAEEKKHPNRRSLLPWWIKVFSWIFMVMGSLAVPMSFLALMFGISFQIALYGLATNEPGSMIGLLLTILFLLKGIVGYGLWTQRDWAIKIGMVDASLGIIICVLVMLAPGLIDNTIDHSFTFRLELVALIPYLIMLTKIKPEWDKG